MESVRKLHILLLIGVMCVVKGIDQNCPYSDPACEPCDWEMTCRNLPRIPPLNTGANVSLVKQISFLDGNITTISKDDLPPGLTLLNLNSLPLTNISEDAFDRSGATLEFAFFYKAKFSSLPTALKNLTRLKNLIVKDTPVQIWNTDTLIQIGATVESIQLENVSFSSWPSWISNFGSLNRLALSWNSVKSIPDNAFEAFKNKLTTLSLAGTGLTHVPTALSTLSNLSFLTLSNNSFTDESEFKAITGSPFAKKLSSLYLKFAGLNTMPDFSNMTDLTNLDLSNNNISAVPPGTLPTSIFILHFEDNRLSSVPKDIATMSKLIAVGLHDNLISVIEPNTFPLSLKRLNLASNQLTAITNTTFNNLSLLEFLDLSGNPISVIEPSAFSELTSLENIYIESENLSEIPLAVTSLKTSTSTIFTIARPISCTCPAPQQLVKWFASLDLKWNIHVRCSNGQAIGSYLSDECGEKNIRSLT